MGKLLVEVFGWSAIALVLLGIWAPDYNGQIFGTAAVAVLLMSVAYANVDKNDKP